MKTWMLKNMCKESEEENATFINEKWSCIHSRKSSTAVNGSETKQLNNKITKAKMIRIFTGVASKSWHVPEQKFLVCMNIQLPLTIVASHMVYGLWNDDCLNSNSPSPPDFHAQRKTIRAYWLNLLSIWAYLDKWWKIMWISAREKKKTELVKTKLTFEINRSRELATLSKLLKFSFCTRSQKRIGSQVVAVNHKFSST